MTTSQPRSSLLVWTSRLRQALGGQSVANQTLLTKRRAAATLQPGFEFVTGWRGVKMIHDSVEVSVCIMLTGVVQAPRRNSMHGWSATSTAMVTTS